MNRVVIIGGGLAGMTVAKTLLDSHSDNLEVVILEADSRLGGKAGADQQEIKARVAERTIKGRAAALEKRTMYVEHGYHIFPGWYDNLRQILKEIGVDRSLVDIENFHVLQKGRWEKGGAPRFNTFYPMSSPWNLVQNTLSLADVLSLPEAVLGFYAMIDLISTHFQQRAALDQVSANGFFRSRYYATEGLARFHTDSILQATSVPTYEISAMTLRKATALWFAEDLSRWSWRPTSLADMMRDLLVLADPLEALDLRKPPASTPNEVSPNRVYSILNGNLQSALIDPFRIYLEDRGATIKVNCRVTGLRIDDGRVAAVTTITPAKEHGAERGDAFVIATPPEVTTQLIKQQVQDAEDDDARGAAEDRTPLSDVARLETTPMAGMMIIFNRQIAGMPKEHVNLLQSRFGLSFIDVSQHWEELGPVLDAIATENRNAAAVSAKAMAVEQGVPAARSQARTRAADDPTPYTVLSVIAANFKPLIELEPNDAIQHLVNELFEYIGADWEDIWYMSPPILNKNDKAPLYMNTVGSWQFRPGARTRIRNLFMAGDYCRTEVDLTTMESAAASGLTTAREILRSLGVADADERIKIRRLRRPDRRLVVMLKYTFAPFVPVLAAAPKLWKLLGSVVSDPEAKREF